MKILFLSAWFPVPQDNGAKIRIYNLIKGLSKQHEIYLISFYDGARSGIRGGLEELKRFCRQVEVVPVRPYRPGSIWSMRGFLDARPRSIAATYAPEMGALIRHALHHQVIDVVVASELAMGAYAPAFSGTPAILEELELVSLYEAQYLAGSQLQRIRYSLAWRKLSRYIRGVMRQFRACTVVSDQELRLAAELAPAGLPIVKLPNCIDAASYRMTSRSLSEDTLIFTGSLAYPVNYEAVLHFLIEIFPIIRKQRPSVVFKVTGSMDGRSIPPSVPLEGVEFTGFVDHIRQEIASSTISVVPLKSGGGTRLKILEAFALGTPVVSTSKGAEGLEVESGKHLILANTAEEFALAVIQLLDDRPRQQKIARNGYRLVTEKYDWNKNLSLFHDLLDRVQESPPDAWEHKPQAVQADD